MPKILVHWSIPVDPESFEKDYLENHLPLTRAWSAATSIEAHRSEEAGVGSPGYVFEAQFATNEDLNAALSSPATGEIQADAQRLEQEHQAASKLFLLRETLT